MSELDYEASGPNERASALIVIKMILESIEREIDFLRKRSGHIYFFLFLVEGLFLVGDRKLVFPKGWDLFSRIINSILFLAIGFIGYYLGEEYRDRIHQLKSNRKRLLENRGYPDVYPKPREETSLLEKKRFNFHKRTRSEIKTLYFLLLFLSLAGILITLSPYLFK